MEADIKEDYFRLLRFESVGTDPAHLRDCADCALWLRKWLEGAGFRGELMMPEPKGGTAAPPILLAERAGTEGAATVLVYGHYDVQPVDPVSEWNTPPFEPTEIDGRVYCRGAQDDKGQTFAFLCGIRDFIASAAESGGAVPTVKVILEGQEESGSGALISIAPEIRRRIAADVLLVCDTSAGQGLRPTIVVGLRGVCHFTATLTGPNRDLHSGEYGGIAPNAAQAIAELVSSLHNPDGSIAVQGFLDGAEPPTEEEMRLADMYAASEKELADDIGCEPVGGEAGRSVAERNSFGPTIEINGIHSGYGGAGGKTVVPHRAMAKVSMRLVQGQNPHRAFEAVSRHLRERCPRGMRLEISEVCKSAPGFRLPLDTPIFRLASHALAGMDPRGPAFKWDGASIPVISVLREASGAAPLMVGWGQPEDRIHSPNESYSLVQFARAREWGRTILENLV